MNSSRSGYILVLTLMIISLSIILVTYLSSRSAVYMPYARTVIDRTKAREIALGGIQIAVSQLSSSAQIQEAPPAQAGTKKQQPTQEDQAKELIKTIFPVLNRWQTFELRKERDGIKGNMQVYVACEGGKIDINKIYNFETKKFIGEDAAKGDMKKVMEQLFKSIEIKPAADLFAGFEKFLKERQYKVQDVTELLAIKEFEGFKNTVFFEPSDTIEAQPTGDKKYPAYLTDIFTVWSGNDTIEPWMLSHSLLRLLGLKQAVTKKEAEEKIQEALKKFKMQAAWPKDWDQVLAPLYVKQFASLPKGIEPLLSDSFDVKTFSVLSYGKVGTLTQRLLAIVERKLSSNGNEPKVDVAIKKLYWL